MVGHWPKYPQNGKLEMLTFEPYRRRVQVNKAENGAKWWKTKDREQGRGNWEAGSGRREPGSGIESQ
jgi:hypothetical protein